MFIQGREIGKPEIDLIVGLLAEHPLWNRTRLSRELCDLWAWRNALGQPKDMAARTLLLKLERAELIKLPARQTPSPNARRNQRTESVPPLAPPICGTLGELQPLSVSIVAPKSEDAQLFQGLLAHYHYLGHRNTVGENLRYLVRDRHGREVACILFGSAAWKCAERDDFIGWDHPIREKNLQRLTNNTRFLILPWVKVPHLASHLLGIITRRIRADWQGKYGHPIAAIETFVDRSRFVGSCYRAANWRHLGQTKGRTRNDRHTCIKVPVKDIYLFALTADFRKELGA